MSAAVIVIDQTALPAGVPGESRDDVVTGTAVQLTNQDNSGVRSWRWELLHRPLNSTAVLSSSVTPNPTFIPDVVGTYRVQLLVDEANEGQRDIRTVIVRDANMLRIPARGERDESNYDVAGSPNADGWWPDMAALLELVRAQLGAGAAGGGWTEEYLGDFTTVASDTDLATGTNPTVDINGVTWTSNAGDAESTVEQAATTSFDCTTADGLVWLGDGGIANFNGTGHRAAHVWASWADLLGSEPPAGKKICLQFYFTNETATVNLSGFGVGVYWPNDGSSISGFTSNSAPVDEKGLSCRWEQNSGNDGMAIREGSSDIAFMFAPNLPAGWNCGALIFESSSSVTGAVGVHDGTDFPDPDDMVRIDTWHGSALGFSTNRYLLPEERVALFFQNSASSYTATIEAIRVLTK